MKASLLALLLTTQSPRPIDPNVGVCHELRFHELLQGLDEVEAITGIRQADIPIQPSQNRLPQKWPFQMQVIQGNRIVTLEFELIEHEKKEAPAPVNKPNSPQ